MLNKFQPETIVSPNFFSLHRTINALKRWQKLIHAAKTGFLLLCFLCLFAGLVLYKVLFITNMSSEHSFWILYGLLATSFLISRIPYAYLHKDEHSAVYPDNMYPDVSVVVAAKNEEKGVFKTITTIIESRYPGKIECIIIDDGSSDGTKKEILRAQAVYGGKIKLIGFHENKGKREAMAAGINKAQYEIIVFVDSDSFLAADAIHHIVEHFLADEKVGAVAGNTRAENADANLLTKMQSIQYAISFDIYKASESVYHSVTCCPGCFSAYRKNAIKPLVNEWKNKKFLGTKGTFGDDRSLTNFILKDWDVIYCEKAKATTMVPKKFSVYFRQQLRWKKSWLREGTMASFFMWKNRHPLASLAFYTNFSFPILGPILAASILIKSITTHNPIFFIFFVAGFMLLGIVFALFVRLYHDVKNWYYIPLVSILYFSVFIWQMPYALLTIRKTHWGTR